MIHSFKAISLSYKTSPIKIRESVALNEKECRMLLGLIKAYIPASDILVLSTCNRTEIYYAADKDLSHQLIQLIAQTKGISDTGFLFSYFDIINSATDAIRHLFHVALGLESQVIGDLQIASQVKKAYQYTTDAGLAGPFLHRLMHTIFNTSKRVAQETYFRDGAASVSYATLELARELTITISNPEILLIGLGEIGTDVCKNLCKAAFSKVKIANRTLEKSLCLASAYPVEVVEWNSIPEHIATADVVISAVPELLPFFRKTFIEKLDIADYKYFIDLSMPRSIENGIEAIPGVILFNIDDIKNKASEALEKRKAAIPQVKELIKEAIICFTEWSDEMAISPVIHKFKDALNQIRQQEINRFVKNMTEEENKKVEQITKNIMQKILKLPVLELKAACKRGEAEQMSEILSSLFSLMEEEKLA